MNRVLFGMATCMALWNFGSRPELRADETIVFYPTAAARDADGVWRVPIHANVHEPDIDSMKRRVLLTLLAGVIDARSKDVDTDLFKTRARVFLVENEKGKEIRIKLPVGDANVGKSAANGHATGELTLDDAQARQLGGIGKSPWLKLPAVLPEAERRTFTADVQLIEPRGLSVISDLDDTIKISQVADRRELLRNTFLKPFVAVPGMAEQYARWESDGAVFHYVSSSPWQLFGVLEEFRVNEKFPSGTWTMKHLRLTDRSAVEFFRGHESYKSNAIEQFLSRYPQRKFVLVGDTGEDDPEIYGAVARKHPAQVVKILIRDSKSGKESPERNKAAFADLPDGTWQVFTDAKELREALKPEWFATDKSSKVP
ncbi:MAG: App1 family protein [Pirellulales bacterium]